jgi:hypothetical protein
MAAVLLPALIKETDKSVADKEIATLKSFADAFEKYVTVSRTIPDQTSWYTNISSQLGFSPNDVLYNVRQQDHLHQRVFLIDPTLQVGNGGGLPYVQASSSASGSPMLPVNPRLMIVSSLGAPLPMASGLFGTPANNYFADLWNWNPTNAVMPNDTPWSGWTGNPTDVIVQRIDLAPLFFAVQLITDSSSASFGYYDIDGLGSPVPAYHPTNDFTHYFIQGSVLDLYDDPSTLDTKLIINSAGAFFFKDGAWHSYGNGAGTGPGVMDLGAVVQQFLSATPNVNAANQPGNAQQVLIVNDMLSYMKNYNAWANTGYTDNILKNQAISVQGTMMSDIAGIYSGTACANCPANPGPCNQ